VWLDCTETERGSDRSQRSSQTSLTASGGQRMSKVCLCRTSSLRQSFMLGTVRPNSKSLDHYFPPALRASYRHFLRRKAIRLSETCSQYLILADASFAEACASSVVHTCYRLQVSLSSLCTSVRTGTVSPITSWNNRVRNAHAQSYSTKSSLRIKNKADLFIVSSTNTYFFLCTRRYFII
jgi:hypothetical protein